MIEEDEDDFNGAVVAWSIFFEALDWGVTTRVISVGGVETMEGEGRVGGGMGASAKSRA